MDKTAAKGDPRSNVAGKSGAPRSASDVADYALLSHLHNTTSATHHRSSPTRMTSVSSYGGYGPPLPGGNVEFAHARFERAVDIVQGLPRSGPIQTNYNDKLILYSSYKQATEGDVNVSRPGMLDMLGRAKWDAWNKRKGLAVEDAERLYVQALVKILRGYADRPQAVALVRELEQFSLDPRGMGGVSSSLAPSDYSTSSSTEDGSLAPPQASSSRHLQPPSTSRRRAVYSTPQSRRSRTGAPSIVSNSVAPSLPGYGPPRTRADSPRRGSDGEDDDEDGGRYEFDEAEEEMMDAMSVDDDIRQLPMSSSHNAGRRRPPPSSSRQQVPGRQLFPPSIRPSHSLASSLNAGGQENPYRIPLAPPPNPANDRDRLAARHSLDNLRHIPESPGGPAHGAQQAIAFLPGATPPPPPAARASGVDTTPRASGSGSAASPGLDAALDRIQTSLTALHERLAQVERTSITSTSTSTTDSLPSLLKQSFIQLLVLLHLRRSPARTTSTTSVWLRLFNAFIRVARRVMGDLAVVLVVVGVLGRVTGRGDGGLGRVVRSAVLGAVRGGREGVREGRAVQGV